MVQYRTARIQNLQRSVSTPPAHNLPLQVNLGRCPHLPIPLQRLSCPACIRLQPVLREQPAARLPVLGAPLLWRAVVLHLGGWTSAKPCHSVGLNSYLSVS